MACVAVYNLYLGAYQGFAQPAGRNAVARLQAKLNEELNAFKKFLNAFSPRVHLVRNANALHLVYIWAVLYI